MHDNFFFESYFQVHIAVENPNYVPLIANDLNVNFTYDDYTLGSVDALHLEFPSRASKKVKIDGHLYSNSPLVTVAISSELAAHGYFTVNYTGIMHVKYLGLKVLRKLRGSKNTTMVTMKQR